MNAERVMEEKITCSENGLKAVLVFAFPLLINKLSGTEINGVGHRVVHGGNAFDQAVVITNEVETIIESLNNLAPLHNPINLKGIRIARSFFTDIPHIAVFDTAFHNTLPKRAKTYALPVELCKKHGVRRYGFHGTSHDYVSKAAANYLKTDIKALRIITCHLGSGCSLAAVEYGRSIETSMGLTPLEGLVMGTRSGDIDAGIISYLAEQENLSVTEIDILLNKQSGLKGISGTSDMRDIINNATNGDDSARLALQVFTHRLRKYIGAYAAVMGGVDAIVFTGGIGENSPVIRHRSSQRLDFLGAIINEDKNANIQLTDNKPVEAFSMNHSRVQLLVIKTDEQFSIARQTANLVAEKNKVNTIPSIPIAVSARHMHITQQTLDQLFGEGYELTERNPLSQPNQFAANETVTIVGPKNRIEGVRILGPVRSKNQIEISRTDEFYLGIDAPVRESGKVENSAGCKVIGTKGEINLNEGLICAWRHIHMTPKDAAIFGVEDRDVVEVEITEGSRSLTFGNVLIRVSKKYKLEMHIDTDEANAAELGRAAQGVLLKTDGSATLKKKKLS
ncbi:UNVERIFIED_CONTAM: hypothetical protein GTU68_038813 [Idotea baltica]|nr:hypothetical protein [Idotea baltica]